VTRRLRGSGRREYFDINDMERGAGGGAGDGWGARSQEEISIERVFNWGQPTLPPVVPALMAGVEPPAALPARPPRAFQRAPRGDVKGRNCVSAFGQFGQRVGRRGDSRVSV